MAPAGGLSGARIFAHPWFAPLVVGLLALAIRLLNLDKQASLDELYHLLAAQSWLAEGTLAIAEGVYERTSLFTLMIAGWMGLFGDDLAIARLPSVLAGTALVVAVFLWVRHEVSARAAWLAGLLLVFWPEGIEVSQFLRFYALHGLLFWLGAIAVYRLISTRFEPWTAAGTAAAMAGALYLQEVSLIGILGLAAWVGLVLGLPWAQRAEWRHLLAAGGALMLVGGLTLWGGRAAGLLDQYRSAPLWNLARADDFWYYHALFSVDYGVLWPLTAVAVLIGFATRPHPTGFCVGVFAVAFLVHSFAASKATRYFYYVTPFLFVIWGLALAELWPRLRAFFGQLVNRLALHLPLPPDAGRRAAQALLGLTLLFAVFSNLALPRAIALGFDVYLPPFKRPEDWRTARAYLADRLEDVSVVVTTNELSALYYLGRYDLLVSKSRLRELEERHEFARDHRTGRPVISTPQSMLRVMECYPDGLIVSPDHRWGNPAQLDESVADLVHARAERLDLPAFGMLAYVWQNPPGPPLPGIDCAGLPGLGEDGTAARAGRAR